MAWLKCSCGLSESDCINEEEFYVHDCNMMRRYYKSLKPTRKQRKEIRFTNKQITKGIIARLKNRGTTQRVWVEDAKT